MAVVIETTLGDITVDLFLKQRPVTCLNFLKLCKMKYYNFNLFHSIRSGFIAQTGDPTGEGSGGESIWGILEGPNKRFFSGEKMPRIRHTDAGLLSMVCTGDMMVGSQFFFTLSPDLDSLDSQHCVIGEVTEGHDVLRKLNEVICDESHRPYRDVRITHTVILEDPFNDPTGFRAPSRSPSPSADRLRGGRIAPDEEVDETQGKSIAEVQEIIDEKEAKARATILEIIGDLPDAEIAPPENVLFVCKLNPVTTDEDLEIIFSRFGKIVSCEVIRDKKSGDSLQYAFIEFSDKKSCEDAYFKMDNVLIDDRRIHVDFSQSVSKMKWLGKGRGVKHFTDEEIKQQNNNADKTRAHSRDKEPRSRRDRDSNREKRDDRKNNEKDRHNNSKEHRHSERSRQYDKYSSKDRDRHEDRERRNRTDSRDNRESRRDKEDKRNIENGKNAEKANNEHNNSSQNMSRSKLKEDSKTSRKHKSSPERGNQSTEERLNRHKESENSKKDEQNKSTERNKNEERKVQTNSHKERETHRDRNHHKVTDDEMEVQASRRKKESKQNNSTRAEKQKTYNNQTEIKNKSTDKILVEPKTPSPSPMKKIKDKANKKKESNKKLKAKDSVSKKKRKRKRSSSSSSSDSDSETSSSSSSSSSDESEKRKKSYKKRKYSTSSTSSSSSDSSSTTSSSSSDSSSDSEPKKKKSKKNSRKKLGSKKK